MAASEIRTQVTEGVIDVMRDAEDQGHDGDAAIGGKLKPPPADRTADDPYAAVSAAREARLLANHDELELEFLALPTPGPKTLHRLRAQGIENEVLGNPLLGPRSCRISWMANDRFDFDDDGDLALVVPAIEERAVVDLAAFHPRQPTRIATLENRAIGLGIDLITSPWRIGEPTPVPIVQDVLEWLRLSGRGVIILNEDAFRRRVTRIEQCPPLAASSVKHGRELRKLLTPAPWAVPTILVPKEQERISA